MVYPGGMEDDPLEDLAGTVEDAGWHDVGSRAHVSGMWSAMSGESPATCVAVSRVLAEKEETSVNTANTVSGVLRMG